MTLQILILLLKSHRTVQLEKLAALFPQPITFESRRRNAQRFLKLPKLNVKLLWFPLIKQIVKLELSGKNKNREQRRKLRKLKQAVGDREFQGVQLDKYPEDRGVAFILRQKKNTYTQLKDRENYQALSELETNWVTRNLFQVVTHIKSHKIESFNLAIY
ncbi:MAG: hypothetical protein IM473_14135 [Microcystis sp. M015S2]|uniref:hypothetical protein n=1 Tax=unclassified Microcystis TaxID=2643300 RepID=UPI0025839385|nr:MULTISPECIES: hypothetical protein [unclassified Microcystis]MCA2711253.1 hypothetical protein [Microcystis sp. M025S2]MCA2743505.1 hypothetical protein [Microcystis sp. M015S2]MCA2761018.1 hypothetical protein [Microcystis sp. M145S2]